MNALRESLKDFGRETVIGALQCGTQSENNLPGMLQSHVVRALCNVMGRSHLWGDAGERLFKAMDQINLEDLAQATVSRAPRVATSELQALLDADLRPLLGPPSPSARSGRLVELCPLPKEAASALPRRNRG